MNLIITKAKNMFSEKELALTDATVKYLELLKAQGFIFSYSIYETSNVTSATGGGENSAFEYHTIEHGFILSIQYGKSYDAPTHYYTVTKDIKQLYVFVRGLAVVLAEQPELVRSNEKVRSIDLLDKVS